MATELWLLTIACRDFNADLLTFKDNVSVKQYFDHIGLKSKLPHVVTITNYIQIDNIISKIEINAGTYNAIFSYHKPLWIKF